MRVVDEAAFILHRRPFGDSSLILDVLSETYGRISLLAKGARKRRDSSAFQPFNRLSLSWTGRSDLKTLTSIDAMPLPLGQDCYLAAYYVNELLLYLMPAQDPHEGVFASYQQLLLVLSSDNMERELRNFEMDLLSVLGLMPDLQRLSHDGHAISEVEMYIVEADNGVRPCSPGEVGGIRGRVLKAIHQRSFDEPEVCASAKSLLRQIIDFNLHGRALQSRKLFQQMLRNRLK